MLMHRIISITAIFRKLKYPLLMLYGLNLILIQQEVIPNVFCALQMVAKHGSLIPFNHPKDMLSETFQQLMQTPAMLLCTTPIQALAAAFLKQPMAAVYGSSLVKASFLMMVHSLILFTSLMLKTDLQWVMVMVLIVHTWKFIQLVMQAKHGSVFLIKIFRQPIARQAAFRLMFILFFKTGFGLEDMIMRVIIISTVQMI